MPQVAFRAIRSRRKFDKAPQIVAALRSGMQRVVKPHFIKQHEKVVANWDHKVGFASKAVISPDAIILYVYATGPNKQLWVWNVEGTRPHKIRAKRAPSLAFDLGYKPKTSAKPYYYGGPGVAMGPTVFAKEVMHPGTEGRPHVTVIKVQNRDWYNKTMENLWKQAIRSA